MPHQPSSFPDLGPTTEARFRDAFAAAALIPKRSAAALLGIDPGTLDALTTEGVIRAVPRGKLRAYTERDLRAYLIEGVHPQWALKSPVRTSFGAKTSPTAVLAFTARPRSKTTARQKG